MSQAVLIHLRSPGDNLSDGYDAFLSSEQVNVRSLFDRFIEGPNLREEDYEYIQQHAEVVVVLGHGLAGGQMFADQKGTKPFLDGTGFGVKFTGKALYLFGCCTAQSSGGASIASAAVAACASVCVGHDAEFIVPTTSTSAAVQADVWASFRRVLEYFVAGGTSEQRLRLAGLEWGIDPDELILPLDAPVLGGMASFIFRRKFFETLRSKQKTAP